MPAGRTDGDPVRYIGVTDGPVKRQLRLIVKPWQVAEPIDSRWKWTPPMELAIELPQSIGQFGDFEVPAK